MENKNSTNVPESNKHTQLNNYYRSTRFKQH